MPLTDSVRDQLLSLEVAANALMQYCTAAKDNANSDDVQTDPMMSSVRRGFLAVNAIGNQFLAIDRVATVVRSSGTAVVAAIEATVTAGATRDEIVALFVATKTYSPTQIRSVLFPYILADDVTPGNVTAIESTLGITL